jgi:hypothetical protein
MDLEERDLELAAFLEGVDPASFDPNYWLRFQSWVLKGAAPELARRRLMAHLTVSEVLTGWARAVVPAAVAAAMMAGVFLLRSDEPVAVHVAPASVEELLLAGMGDETFPATLHSEEAASAIAFASERF